MAANVHRIPHIASTQTIPTHYPCPHRHGKEERGINADTGLCMCLTYPVTDMVFADGLYLTVSPSLKLMPRSELLLYLPPEPLTASELPKKTSAVVSRENHAPLRTRLLSSGSAERPTMSAKVCCSTRSTRICKLQISGFMGFGAVKQKGPL